MGERKSIRACSSGVQNDLNVQSKTEQFAEQKRKLVKSEDTSVIHLKAFINSTDPQHYKLGIYLPSLIFIP